MNKAQGWCLAKNMMMSVFPQNEQVLSHNGDKEKT
jgi:hypothetical protein